MSQNLDYLFEKDIDLPLGKVFSEGLKLYGKTIGWFIIFGIICFIGLFVAAVIIGLFSFIPVVGQVISQLLLVVVQLGLLAGVLKFLGNVYKTDDANFSDFFSGFQYLGSVFIVYLIVTIASLIAVAIPVGSLFTKYANQMDSPTWFNNFYLIFQDPLLLGSGVFGVLLFLVVSVFTMFANEIAVNSEQNGIKAISYSVKMVSRKLGPVIVLILSIIFLFVLGVLPFIFLAPMGSWIFMLLAVLFATFFLYPYAACIYHVSYEYLFRKHEGNEVEDAIEQFGEEEFISNSEEHSDVKYRQ